MLNCDFILYETIVDLIILIIIDVYFILVQEKYEGQMNILFKSLLKQDIYFLQYN
jgi:hypothetical protein